MPPAPSITESAESKVLPTYRVRTMAGDLEAAKNRTQPSAIPITIEPPEEPEKKEENLILEESKKISSIKPSFPKISFKEQGYAGQKSGFFNIFKKKEKIEITPDESPQIRIRPSPIPIKNEIRPSDKPLISPRPLTPMKPQPFSSPINKPIVPNQQKMEPQQQTTYSPPPPGLPTIPVPPQMPARPLTPPPPPRPTPDAFQDRMARPPMPPPIPPQMQKLPPIPQRPNFPSIQTPGLPPMEQMKPKKGKMIAIVAVSALILTFIAGEIWWFFLRPQAQTTQQTSSEVLPSPQNVQPLLPEGTATTPTAPVKTAPELPTPILSYVRTKTVGAESLADLSGAVSADEFVRFVVQSPAQTAGAASTETAESASPYADISAAAKMLKLKIPVSLSQEFSGDFDVFAFGGSSFDQDECTKAKNTSETCYGPRLGLAIKVLDAKKTLAALKIWEKTMAADLKPLLFAKAGGSATANFQTGTYGGQTIRYKNMPINTITIEYALSDDILIITTSKSAILKAIDSLPASGGTTQTAP